MRILMVLYNQVGRGTYWRALNLARSLVKQGHPVTLLAMSRDQRLHVSVSEDAGVAVVAMPGSPTWIAAVRLGPIGRVGPNPMDAQSALRHRARI